MTSHHLIRKTLALTMIMVAVALSAALTTRVKAATLPNNLDYSATTGTTRNQATTTDGTALTNESGVNISFPTGGNFTLSYVDSPGYQADGYAGSVQPLETKDSAGNWTVQTDKNNLMANKSPAYTGGYIQAQGKLSIKAVLNSGMSNLTAQTAAGNYAVMVQVKMPADVDVKAMAAAIVWDKAFFDLSLSAPLNITPRFPMQFDHHVYLDPNDPTVFYLKVKGIPYNYSTSTGILGNSATLSLANYDGDHLDFQNNRYMNNGNMTYLQPASIATSNTSNTTSTGPFRDPWFLLGGAMSSNGDIGWSLALINSAPLYNWLFSDGFTGSANINFYVNMAKYNGNLSDASPDKVLTKGKLFPSAKADGSLNIGMKMYGSGQLNDPYSVGSGSGQMKPGLTPANYALVNTNQVTSGTSIPVTSHITSWNTYASPWDTRTDGNPLNTATSAWEEANGESSELPNVTTADSWLDRVAHLRLAQDGLMVSQAKTGDATGTDYSGSQNGVIGAVGTNRFARFVNYFDLSHLDSDGNGSLAKNKQVVTPSDVTQNTTIRTAASAGIANPATDATATLPNLHNQADQYVYYAGTVKRATANVPILAAPAFFTQESVPAPSVALTGGDITVFKSDLSGGKTVKVTGSWTDDYATNDGITAKDDKSGNTVTVASGLSTTSPHEFNLQLTSGSVSGALDLGSGSTLIGTHTVTATMTQPTVSLANGQKVTTNQTATATIKVTVIDDSASIDVAMQKAIVANGQDLTTLPVKNPSGGQPGQTVTLKSTLTNQSATTIANPMIQSDLSSDLTYANQLKVTVNGDAVAAKATVSGTTLQITLPSPLKPDDQAVITYQVTVTSALPSGGLSLLDLLYDGSDTLANKSNSVTLTPVPDGVLELLMVPGPLNFGTHDYLPDPKRVADFNNEGTANTLQVLDGRSVDTPWVVDVGLSPFVDQAGQAPNLTSAAIDFDTTADNNLVTAGGATAQLVRDTSSTQGLTTYQFPNISLQVFGDQVQSGNYQATVTYTVTDSVN